MGKEHGLFISWFETKSYTMIAEVIRKVQDPYIVSAQLKFRGLLLYTLECVRGWWERERERE